MLAAVNECADLVVPAVSWLALGGVFWADGGRGVCVKLGKLGAAVAVVATGANLASLNAYADLAAAPLAAFALIAAAVARGRGGGMAAARRRPPPPPPSAAAVAVAAAAGPGTLDAMGGAWRLASSENYDAYLAAIGVGRIGRALAKRAPTAQTLSFSFSGASVRIQTDGLLRMDARYEIGGPPVEVAVKGVAFSDRAFRIRAEPIRDSRYGSTRACRNESAKTLSPVVGEPRGAEDRTVPRKLGKRV